MAPINKALAKRISDKLKYFQSILKSAKAKDVNESDTVVIITDMLHELFGYNKYTEITSEHSIRNTWCDLAIILDEKVKILIEVKAIGLDLKAPHIKQAIDYAANKGVDWVILTNGVDWKIFRVRFEKPINQELVAELDFLQLNHKKIDHLETLSLLCREGVQKYSLENFQIQKQATNKFLIGNMLTTEPVLLTLRKQLKQLYPDIKVQLEEIQETLVGQVIKREIIEGEEADDARKRITKAARKLEKKGSKTTAAIEG